VVSVKRPFHPTKDAPGSVKRRLVEDGAATVTNGALNVTPYRGSCGPRSGGAPGAGERGRAVIRAIACRGSGWVGGHYMPGLGARV